MIAADAAAGLAGGIISGLDKLFTSDDEREAAKLKLAQALQAPLMGQIEVNKVEAASTSWFTSGWRPAIGWAGACGMAYNFILRDLLAYGLVLYDSGIIPPPRLETGELMAMVTGMLGLAGVKSYDLAKGTRK